MDMGFYSSSNPFGSLGRPGFPIPPPPPKKRKAFFSFHFSDIMRVNVVRNAWKIDHPDAPFARSFYDSSLWESRQREGDQSLKNLIRQGVDYTSAVCVLIGAETWLRRWVCYEIARAVIDGRGLLAVHLNNIRHHVSKQSHPLGYNPLGCMGVGKVQASIFSSPLYYLFEWNGREWGRYGDYTLPVKLPTYLPDPFPGYISLLSTGTEVYDWVGNDGHKNIGGWIDRAAQQVGR